MFKCLGCKELKRLREEHKVSLKEKVDKAFHEMKRANENYQLSYKRKLIIEKLEQELANVKAENERLKEDVKTLENTLHIGLKEENAKCKKALKVASDLYKDKQETCMYLYGCYSPEEYKKELDASMDSFRDSISQALNQEKGVNK